MSDIVYDLYRVKQPIRALMYESLIWKHIFGVGLRGDQGIDAPDCHAFTYHENGSIRLLMGVISFLVIIEGLAIDFFVATKSTRAAILLGVLHVAMFLYSIALMKASKQRLTLVSCDGILLRISLIYCCWIPRHTIKSVSVLDKEVERDSASDVLWCALGDQPNVFIQLTEPVTAVLPFGIIRSPKCLYVYLDSPADFAKASLVNLQLA